MRGMSLKARVYVYAQYSYLAGSRFWGDPREWGAPQEWEYGRDAAMIASILEAGNVGS